MCEPHDRLRKHRAKTQKLLCSSWNSYIIDQKQFTLRSIEQSTQHVEIKLLNNFWSHKKSTPSRAWMLKSRGPILHVTSSETRSVCVKQALNTRCWLVNALQCKYSIFALNHQKILKRLSSTYAQQLWICEKSSSSS